MSFLNVTKYPPSLFFTFMTQGPILILLALTEQTDNAFSRICTVYGRVPFFFFLVHFYLIHIMTLVVVFLSGYTWQQATDDSLFLQIPAKRIRLPARPNLPDLDTHCSRALLALQVVRRVPGSKADLVA